MYRMTYDITIGDQRVRLLEKVVIKRSVENLADTATIYLPAYHLGRPLSLLDAAGKERIHEGDKVSIAFGYDGNNQTEFAGYVDDIYIGKDGIEIRCMDPLWLFKNTSVKDNTLKAPKLKDILEEICPQVSPDILIDCSYDIGYDKFIIRKATAYDVLTKIHEEIKADIYFCGNTLYLHPPYSNVNEGVASLNFSKNIETSDLKYVREKDRKIEVEIVIKYRDGSDDEKITAGNTGGKKVTLYALSTDKEEAKKMAQREFEARSLDSYEGSVTGWLLPYVEPDMAVQLFDNDLPERNGKYYVVATETTFSKSGGQRKITLGHRLDAKKKK